MAQLSTPRFEFLDLGVIWLFLDYHDPISAFETTITPNRSKRMLAYTSNHITIYSHWECVGTIFRYQIGYLGLTRGAKLAFWVDF